MEADITHRAALFVLQIGLILLAAKVGGELVARLLGQPPLVGEILAGVAIGPYALGGLSWPVGAPFPPVAGTVPVSVELYAIAQLAAVVLLFVAGLETDRALFVRYLGPAVLVGLGGVILPFAGGAWLAVLGGGASSFTDPVALFVGATMTATSVGITARVLTDLHRLDTPEAVTVVAAAVVDDVLAIMALAIAVGAARGGGVSVSALAAVGATAAGAWVLLTVGFVVAAASVERALRSFRGRGAEVALGLAVALLAAYIAEAFGLAMIIGAYAAGLGLSGRPLARRLVEGLESTEAVLVPVFFTLMGMLVDLRALRGAFVFGVLLTVLAVVTKVVGAAVPALAAGFNVLGAARIGVGMLPRGEVALIVAGMGLAAGAIDTRVFGVAVMMTLVTTLLAPSALVALFRRPASGRRQHAARIPTDP